MTHLLTINKTEDTPQVTLDADKKIFSIEGYSMPEDSLSYYTPIINWLTEYTRQPNFDGMEMQFKMIYFNTASAKQIARLLTVLSTCQHHDKIVVSWKYEADDNEMLRSGKRFSQQLNLNFNFVEVPPTNEDDEQEGVYHIIASKY